MKGKKTEKSQMQHRQQTSVNPMFSNIRNKCIRCRGDHAPGSCPMKKRPQVTQNTAGYQTDDNGAIAGKANTNALPSFSSKNGQPTAANMTPSSPKNSAGAQRCPTCTREPITPQVSPNTSQQNFYSVPPVHPPNHFPPPPYFPIPFPPPPIAPSSASSAHSAPVSDISAVLTLMTNACNARKLEHHSHHDCAGEDNDTICGCLATNHADGSRCAGTGEQECKNGQAI